jgi:hypothetical protein
MNPPDQITVVRGRTVALPASSAGIVPGVSGTLSTPGVAGWAYQTGSRVGVSDVWCQTTHQSAIHVHLIKLPNASIF